MERDSDGARWRGDFTKPYLEDISAKTGSFKKFAVFAKMLVAAVVDSSESVFVDLLTYADLERLKRRRNESGANAKGVMADSLKTEVSPVSQKRYLILTHADEFDRVHYPLPLLFEHEPSPAALQSVVARLKKENKALREGSPGGATEAGELARLRSECARLRALNVHLENRLVAGADVPSVPEDSEFSNRESLNVPPAYEHVERLQAEVKTCTRALVDLKRQLEDSRIERRSLETQLKNSESSKNRLVAKKQRELDDALRDVSKRRDVERELRIKVKDLGIQCEGLERRLKAGGGSYGCFHGVGGYSSKPTSRASSVERGSRPSSRRGGSRSPGGPASSRLPRDAASRAHAHGFRTPTRGRSPSPVPGYGRSDWQGRDRAPRSPRFDPTAYVREKRAREEARFRNSARGAASGAASPARERERVRSRGASPNPRASLRNGAASPGGAHGFGSGASRPWAPSPRRRERSPSPGESSRRASKENFPSPRYASTARHASSTTTRGASPGRVLRDVQRRLTDVAAAGRKGVAEKNAGDSKPSAENSSSRPEDASAEIADIDSRLAALQMFLKEAKAAGSPAGKESVTA